MSKTAAHELFADEQARLSQLKLLVLDVDGTLTDGSIFIGPDGGETKRFSVRDGMGIRLLQENGVQVAVLSARTAGAVDARMKQLKVSCVVQGSKNKAEGIATVLEQTGIAAEQTAFMGDDLVDLLAMQNVGYAMAVGDAVAEVKGMAHWVSPSAGGHGAVREAAEHILKAQGKWAQAVARFL